jgi:hypothetical protein
MLYILCVWVLFHRKRSGWQLISSTLLFFLETVNLALEGAYVLYGYFGWVSIAENWPDSPYQTSQLEKIYAIISAAMQVANLLCLCVGLATSDVLLLNSLPD